MTTLLILAWRNVWRNPGRSLLTIGAVVTAFALISIMRSLQYGTDEQVRSFAIRLFEGDLQVRRAGSDAVPPDHWLSNEERNWDALMSEQPWVTAYARRLVGRGLLGRDAAGAPALVVGVEPVREPATTLFLTQPIEGRRLEPRDQKAMLLGEGLARRLAVGLGDTVAVRARSSQGRMSADAYQVLGLLRTGSRALDSTLSVLSLEDARALFALPGGFSHLVVRSDDHRRRAVYADVLRRQLGGGYEVMYENALMPDRRAAPALDLLNGRVVLGLLLLLVGWVIFQTTNVVLAERVGEFGVLHTVARPPGGLGWLVLVELTLTVGLALVAGALLSGALMSALSQHPIPLAGMLQTLFDTYGARIDALHFSFRMVVLAETTIAVGALALLAVVYPVLRTRRYAPTRAARQRRA